MKNAQQILTTLEQKPIHLQTKSSTPATAKSISEQTKPSQPVGKEEQLSLFGEPPTSKNRSLLQQLKDANLMKMTPLDAMNLLFKLQNELQD